MQSFLFSCDITSFQLLFLLKMVYAYTGYQIKAADYIDEFNVIAVRLSGLNIVENSIAIS